MTLDQQRADNWRLNTQKAKHKKRAITLENDEITYDRIARAELVSYERLLPNSQ